MAYNLACWCIQMAYTQHSWMLMDIVVGLSVHPSVRLFVYGIFRWLCICWQIIWNKWHKIWHADVSPSLISLSQHWCQRVFLSCHAFVHVSNCSWAWLCALRTNRLEEMANKLACSCIQMTYAQLSLTIMGIIAYVSVWLSVGVFICWEMAVAITCGYGGYLLPLLAAHSSSDLLFCIINNKVSSRHIG